MDEIYGYLAPDPSDELERLAYFRRNPPTAGSPEEAEHKGLEQKYAKPKAKGK